MDANFDADLEQLENGHCTIQPHDELEAIVVREQRRDDAFDDLVE